MGYVAANDLNEALSLMASHSVSVIAGGTDWFPAQGERPFDGTLLDITRIDGLRGILRGDAGWRIGAATTWTDVIQADLPPAFDGLKQAAREVGSVQIQNTATVAGNLCNASPAADGVPPLLTLEAVIELASEAGSRRMPLGRFVQGVRQTALRSDELITAIHIPDIPETARGSFVKLGARTYLVISICMVAVLARVEHGVLRDVRIVVGAAAPVARRLTALEAALEGVAVDRTDAAVRDDLIEGLSPISDIRATADYRRDAVAELIRRALVQAVRI